MANEQNFTMSTGVCVINGVAPTGVALVATVVATVAIPPVGCWGGVGTALPTVGGSWGVEGWDVSGVVRRGGRVPLGLDGVPGASTSYRSSWSSNSSSSSTSGSDIGQIIFLGLFPFLLATAFWEYFTLK